MNKALNFKHLTRLPLVVLLAAVVVAATASAATSGGLPPAFGKMCGHVGGASWQFQGHRGTQYTVIASPASVCGVAMKSVGALSKQKPHAGAVGAQTLAGPGGFQCAGSGIPLAHAGFCGKGASHFVWAPQVH